MNNYSDKLRDSRWQRKRILILIRDKFTCQVCGYIGKKVDVHHLSYKNDPWHVDEKELIILCRYCHKTKHTPEINYKRLDNLKISEILKNNKNG